jgi:hypothetical protein
MRVSEDVCSFPSNRPNYWDLSLITQKVERALTLWATGAITIEAVQTSHAAGKAVVLQGTLNKTTGKVSMHALIFNESNWGKKTCSYLNSIQKLTHEWLLEIMKMAMSFTDHSVQDALDHQCDLTTSFDHHDDDICANLVELSDGESSEGSEECTLILITFGCC